MTEGIVMIVVTVIEVTMAAIATEGNVAGDPDRPVRAVVSMK
jgi:hypothetical protein